MNIPYGFILTDNSEWIPFRNMSDSKNVGALLFRIYVEPVRIDVGS